MSSYWMPDDYDQTNTWFGEQNLSSAQSQNNQQWEQYGYSNRETSTSANRLASDYYTQHSQFDERQSSFIDGQMFIPSQESGNMQNSNDFEDEPPLLEELGINFGHIKEKTLAVLNPVGTLNFSVIADQDLAGPLVFCLLFGAALLLHGKVHFGYIYGIGGLGCIAMYALLNLMAAERTISFTCTASVLGYCMLPMSLLCMLTAVLSFQDVIGYIISGAAVLWCSVSASKLFVCTLEMDSQRVLVAYPCTILYCVFALLAIF
ncbi:hypothetical protein AB6A40_002366 [Gnathostoma spinigerum]|uniref:Protein YIPF n=1 Tax=Gnathostoma spinigerum TaxID=75299 RepID=A0ABD6E8M9_9BILA